MKKTNSILLFISAIFLFFCQNAYSQGMALQGKITNEYGEPLIYAHIQIKGTTMQCPTDEEGNYYLPVEYKDTVTLIVSYLGYESQEQTAYHCPYDCVLNFTLKEENITLCHFPVIKANKIYTNNIVSQSDLAIKNTGQDLPYLLENLPSVTVNSDAGTGVGYTGIRIRGSDPTRINITVNGVPMNDAESQQVYWVNMPDLASSADEIEVQRGVGSSTNGAGSFGGSVHIQTNKTEKAEPFGKISNSFGSFQTRKHSFEAGSGHILFEKNNLNNYTYFTGRASLIKSNGYIDRASADLRSFFLTNGYVFGNTEITANLFSGKEKTYQAWGGVPAQYLQTQRRFNPYSYENEIDNYQQTHAQLHINQKIVGLGAIHLTGFYTKGGGYYEQFKTNETLTDYGLQNIQLNDTLLSTTDLIRRRWLDNDFFGGIFNWKTVALRGKLISVAGGAWTKYKGKHFGEIIWAKYASNGAIRHRYYENDAQKTDATIYEKIEWFEDLGKGNIFKSYIDLQYRYVDYHFTGLDKQGNALPQRVSNHFFNPKIGVAYQRQDFRFNLFGGMANKEPNRDDFVENLNTELPKPERLYNGEFSVEYLKENWSLKTNFYYMYYQNQLVLNGKINDVGAYIRTNIPKSNRLGVELEANSPLFFDRLNFVFHFTWSKNKIQKWTEYVDNWEDGSQIQIEHKSTDLSFSPNMIGSLTTNCKIIESQKWRLRASWDSKYVGKQYIDNTQNNLRSLAAFWTNDLRLNLNIRFADLIFSVRNIFGTQYSNNAWTYRFYSPNYDPTPDDPYTTADSKGYYQMTGYFPQAGRQFMLGLNIKF